MASRKPRGEGVEGTRSGRESAVGKWEQINYVINAGYSAAERMRACQWSASFVASIGVHGKVE